MYSLLVANASTWAEHSLVSWTTNHISSAHMHETNCLQIGVSKLCEAQLHGCWLSLDSIMAYTMLLYVHMQVHVSVYGFLLHLTAHLVVSEA